MRIRNTGFFLLPVLAATARFAAPQGPPNDECPGALVLVDGLQGPWDNSTATTSAPAWPLGPVHRDVWFTYRPARSSIAIFRVVGPNFHAALEVLAGGCATPLSLGATTNLSAPAAVAVRANVGVPLWVRVGGIVPESGTFHLEVFHEHGGNDDCSGALPLALGRQGTFSNYGATTSPPAWPTPFPVGRDVWFTLVAPCEGWLSIDVCSATFDSVLEVFAGPCSGPSSLLVADDGCGVGSVATRARLFVRSGTTYALRVGGLASAAGLFDLALSMLDGGCHGRRPTGCGALEIEVRGAAAPGGTLRYDLHRVAGTPFLVFGTALAAPTCAPQPCRIGVVPLVGLPGSSVTSSVPNDPVLAGAVFTVQGIDLGAPGGCAAGAWLPVAVALSDAFDTGLR